MGEKKSNKVIFENGSLEKFITDIAEFTLTEVIKGPYKGIDLKDTAKSIAKRYSNEYEFKNR